VLNDRDYAALAAFGCVTGVAAVRPPAAIAATAGNISASRGLDFRLESADRQQEGTDSAPMRLSSPDYRGPGGAASGPGGCRR